MDGRVLLLVVGIVACTPRVEVPAHPHVEPVDEPTLVVPAIDPPTIPAATKSPRCPDDRSWVKVSAGDVQTCGLHGNGCIECWGGEEYDGRVDTYDTGEFGEWVDYGDDDPPDGVFTDVALAGGNYLDRGSEHACALDVAGNVSCWGRNDKGQSSPPAGSFTALSLASRFSCGLRADTSVACWGGWVGGGEPEGPGYVAIAAGLWSTGCAAHASGVVTCWTGEHHRYETSGGMFSSVALADGELCAGGVDAPLTCWWMHGGEYVPDGLPGGTGFADVCLGSYGAEDGCVRATDGRVTCWGTDFGIAPDTAFSQLSCGASHACGVTTEGRIECWGDCADGQCAVPR